MHKLLKMTVVFVVMGNLGIAHANNLFHASLFNSWTGFYAGANAGMAFNNVQLTSQQLGFTNMSNTCNASSDYSTFFPGIQFGYIYQFQNAFVSGIEANLTVNTNQNQILGCNSDINPNVYDRFSFYNQMQGSIKGRVGHTWHWKNYILLPYIAAGVSVANVGLTYKNEGGDYYSTDTTRTGWVLGAGIEWAFMQHWSVRAEYFYLNYGNAVKLNIPSVYGLMDPNGKANVNLSSNNVVVAVNYWV